MATPKPPFFDLLARQLEVLVERRAALCDEIAEIDRKLASVAKAVGVDPSELQAEPIPSRINKPLHHASEGSMPQFLREFFESADRGYTRRELKQIVRDAEPKFAASISRNENGFYNAVKRLLGNELIELDGVLYGRARAPRKATDHTLFPPAATSSKTATDQ